VNNLQLALNEAHVSRDRDLADLLKSHEEESNKLKEEHRISLDKLKVELTNTRQKCLEQVCYALLFTTLEFSA